MNIEDKLISFAKEYDAIVAITKGVDPENYSKNPQVVYYFMVKGVYDPDLDDEITNLDIQLDDSGFSEILMQCPYIDLRKNLEGFLGEYIWER